MVELDRGSSPLRLALSCSGFGIQKETEEGRQEGAGCRIRVSVRGVAHRDISTEKLGIHLLLCSKE